MKRPWPPPALVLPNRNLHLPRLTEQHRANPRRHPNPYLRLALDFIRVFVGSGNVDTGKILEIYRDSGTYTVPLHESCGQ